MMKKFVITGCVLAFLITPWILPVHAKERRERPTRTVVDADGDGYRRKQDCNDSDSSVYPGASETCDDGIDQDCNGVDLTCPQSCTDEDGDTYALEGGDCGLVDCNDSNNSVYPGGVEICGDLIDQDCSDEDLICSGDDDPSDPHGALVYQGYPGNCLSCHGAEAEAMSNSTHYKWTGEAPDMVNRPEVIQGKLTNAMNSYCINIKGNWKVCGSCHVGRGKKPDDSTAGHENIDCLVCHNEEYATSRARIGENSMGVVSPTDSMVQNIQTPTRVNCLQCHAKAGGGDGVKRGDLSLATGTNTDPHFDVHMNKSGSDLSCQDCHVFENHKVIGKGSDLRPTDDVDRGAEIKCTTCHRGKDAFSGHDDEEIGRHVARVACQTCHIPTYAKVPTEIYRDWRSHAGGLSGPGHPFTLKEENLIPEYMFWNRQSDNALLGDNASKTLDLVMGTYPTSRPVGSIEDGMLYPFKYKTATQPMIRDDKVLIAMDTHEYLAGKGDVDTAIANGLENMRYPRTEPYIWVDTDTYQMLNHGITPASSALQCSSCHGNTNRIDLQNELGYGLKGTKSEVCTQCHGKEEQKPFETIHDKHVKDKGYDCSSCHNFSRPERDLRVRD